VSTPASAARSSAAADSTRPGRARARQRLLEACISALHIYGPSRTTVSRVVALADLSPGIVRFYFNSKAAMLVAALEYLADEFEERVLKPVAALKHSPVVALGLLVELYLDAEIASPRKVSVWYSFWGEASSRQEYLDICGQKDEDFAALVRELTATLIAQTGAGHLDADGVALGLIGVLEVLWQGIAFQSEERIDRRALVARALAYLRSVFPGQFPAPVRERPRRPSRAAR
jgi:TetR/AcrR family transcriptional regulator, transcriptional repressor of bet genes